MSRFRFEGAIFDLDGTLVQSEHLHRQSWVKPLAELGMAVDEDAYLRDFAGKPGLEIIRDHIGLSGPAAIALYNRVTDDYWTMAVEQVSPTPGLTEFLDATRDVPKAVCTSAQRESAMRMIDLLGLNERFVAVVTASDVARGKPDPEPYRLAADRLSVAANRCVAFKDAANGLISARDAGMYCVGVGTGAAVYRDLADFWIIDFHDPRLSELERP